MQHAANGTDTRRAGAIEAGRPGLRTRVTTEVKRYITLFLYLWIMLGLFVLNKDMTLRDHGISITGQGVALINAAVLAKFMLIAEDLHFGVGLRDRPLIVPILCDAGLFSLLFIVCHTLEELVVGLFKGHSLAASMPSFGGGGLAGVICVALIMFVSLIPFFAFRHLSRVLGPGRLSALFLRRDGARVLEG